MQVNQSELADLLDVTGATILSWRRDYGMETVSEGKSIKFDLQYAIAWYLDYKTHKYEEKLIEARSDDVDYDAEYRKWKSTRMKIEAFKESGQLIRVEEAEEAMLNRLIQVRDALKNIPSSWAFQILGLEDKGEAQEKLELLLDDLLTVLSNQPDDIQHTVGGADVIDVDIDDVSDIDDVDVS